MKRLLCLLFAFLFIVETLFMLGLAMNFNMILTPREIVTIQDIAIKEMLPPDVLSMPVK